MRRFEGDMGDEAPELPQTTPSRNYAAFPNGNIVASKLRERVPSDIRGS